MWNAFSKLPGPEYLCELTTSTARLFLDLGERSAHNFKLCASRVSPFPPWYQPRWIMATVKLQWLMQSTGLMLLQAPQTSEMRGNPGERAHPSVALATHLQNWNRVRAPVCLRNHDVILGYLPFLALNRLPTLRRPFGFHRFATAKLLFYGFTCFSLKPCERFLRYAREITLIGLMILSSDKRVLKLTEKFCKYRKS